MHTISPAPQKGCRRALDLKRIEPAPLPANRIGLITPAGNHTLPGEGFQHMADRFGPRIVAVQPVGEANVIGRQFEYIGKTLQMSPVAISDMTDGPAIDDEGRIGGHIVGIAAGDVVEETHI